MADGADRVERPPVLRVGRLRTASEVRRALRRVADSVLKGDLAPNRANSVVFAISAAGRARELEHLEHLSTQLRALRTTPRPALSHETYTDVVDVQPEPAVIGELASLNAARRTRLLKTKEATPE